MGFPKMMLSFNGIPMLERVIINVKNSFVDDIVVVLGAFRNELEFIVTRNNVRKCYNDRYKEGMLSSVICGFKNLPAAAEAALVFQGDQPLITPEVVNRIIDNYRNSKKGISIPVFNNRRGHPLLVDRKYFHEIETLDPKKGLKSLTEIYSDDILEVSVKEAGILRDFDTFEEYKDEINQIQ